MRRSKFVAAGVYYLGKGLAWSPLLVRMLFANLLFALLVVIPNPYRRRIRASVALFFPQLSRWERIVLVHRTMYNALQVAMDILAIWFRGVEWAGKLIKQIHNGYIFEEAAQGNKGVIFMSPHFGNWELLLSYITERYKTFSMYKDSPNDYYNQLMKSYRSSRGGNTIAVDKPAQIKPILRAFKQGQGTALIILPDQRPQRGRRGSTMAEFFGRQIPVSTILHKILQHADCEVICLCAVRRSWSKYEVFVTKPDAEIYSEDAHKSAAALNRCFEEVIRRDPAQYNWLQDKLKHLKRRRGRELKQPS